MTVTVAQVSDTHLSAKHGWFVENWRRVLESLSDPAEPALDLVVSSGDLSINGARSPDDLVFAAAQHARIAAPWRALPGNHDVGEEPGAAHVGQPTGPDDHARWTAALGPSWWSIDCSGWRLIGLDAFLLGTGRPEEAEQRSWCESAVAGAPGPVGLFTHKPLCINSFDERGVDPVWTAHPVAARWLIDLVRRDGPIRFVATGHLHQYRRRTIEGVEHVWAPSTAFPSERAITSDAVPTLGWLRWHLGANSVDVELVEPSDMTRRELEDLRAGADWLYLAPPSPPAPEDL